MSKSIGELTAGSHRNLNLKYVKNIKSAKQKSPIT
jgi:hypothetical protein